MTVRTKLPYAVHQALFGFAPKLLATMRRRGSALRNAGAATATTSGTATNACAIGIKRPVSRKSMGALPNAKSVPSPTVAAERPSGIRVKTAISGFRPITAIAAAPPISEAISAVKTAMETERSNASNGDPIRANPELNSPSEDHHWIVIPDEELREATKMLAIGAITTDSAISAIELTHIFSPTERGRFKLSTVTTPWVFAPWARRRVRAASANTSPTTRS